MRSLYGVPLFWWLLALGGLAIRWHRQGFHLYGRGKSGIESNGRRQTDRRPKVFRIGFAGITVDSHQMNFEFMWIGGLRQRGMGTG